MLIADSIIPESFTLVYRAAESQRPDLHYSALTQLATLQAKSDSHILCFQLPAVL
jgi:hypothetical protein